MTFLSNSSVAIIQGNITGPSTGLKIIGGTSPTSDLFLQTTSGIGTTGADMHFLVGNNGATEAMTILNSGNVGIGTTSPAVKLAVYESSGYGYIAKFYKNGNEFGIYSTSGVNLLGSNTALGFAPNGGAEKVRIDTNGNVGIGTTTPTAYLNIKAGTATANTAPLKLTPGTVNTTAETGAIEYNGTNLSFVPTGTLRENIFTGARGSITLTAGTTTTVTIAQAKTTSTILISPTSLAVISLMPYVSTKNNGSFVITTLTAAGTETLDYIIVN